jgi:hypothetical protein
VEVEGAIAVIRDIVLIAGAIAGGIWGLYKFRKMRMGEPVLIIDLIPEIHHLGNLKIVEVVIHLTNVGKASLFVDCLNNNNLFEVKAIPAEMESDSLINYDDLKPIIPPLKFMEKQYGHWHPHEPYILEPGDEDKISVAFSTSYNGLVYLKASIVDKNQCFYTTRKLVDLRQN